LLEIVTTCAPPQVLDDPPRVADRVPIDDGDRNARLAGEDLDLFAVTTPARHPDLGDLLPVRAQLPGNAATRAQPIRRGPAPVQRRAHETTIT